MIRIITLFSLIHSFSTFGQKTVIWGGTFHNGKGEVISDAYMVINDGKIASLNQKPVDTTNARVIYAKEKHIYPTFILPASTVGLRETDAVRATLDYQEVGQLNPNTRTQIAYNTDSELIPTIRSNGIGVVQVIPKGSLVAGQSSLMKLDGWNWEDATLVKDDGMHIFWPSIINSSGWWEDGKSTNNDSRNNQIELINQFFVDARTYFSTTNPTKNLKLEALSKLFENKQILYIHADHSIEIVEALAFCNKFGISKKVIVGAENCQKAIPMLLETKTPVIFTRTHSLPPQTHKAIDHPYRLCIELVKRGVLVGLSYLGDMEVMGSRNLPFTAGSLVAYGLEKELALSLITSNTAKIIGVDNDFGSLEVGKKASFFISKGDALDIKSNNIELLFIDGKQVEIESKHDKLYQKYKVKYGIE